MLKLSFDGFAGETIAVDGDLVFDGDRFESLRVIGMFVGDEDAREAFRCALDGGEAFADLLAAEAGVDQEPDIVRFQVGAIARGAAAQDGELHWHRKKLLESTPGRQFLSRLGNKFIRSLVPTELYGICFH